MRAIRYTAPGQYRISDVDRPEPVYDEARRVARLRSLPAEQQHFKSR